MNSLSNHKPSIIDLQDLKKSLHSRLDPKLDLELVPKENRLDIRKCNGRIPRRLKPKEETFQVVMDALALTPCHPAFIITADIPEICPRVPGHDFDALPSKKDTLSFLRDLGHTGVINLLNDDVIDQMHQPWRTFAAIINRGLFGKTSGLDKLRLSRAQILWGMYHQKKEASQIYEVVLPACLTSPEMKESKAYKTYHGYAIGTVPPKVARKFKKAYPSNKDSDLVHVDEELVKKGKRLKTPAKKSTSKPTTALIEEAQIKEVKKKSLRDFHKIHASGFGMIAKDPLSVEKITPTVTSKGTGDKPGVPDVTKDDSTKSESESWGNDKDDSNNEQEAKEEVDQENEYEDDEIESDEDKGMDDTTDQFDDDGDARLEEPTQTGKYIVQGEGADVEMDEAQQGNENLETTQEQVVDDAHVTITTVTKKTEVPVTGSSRSSDLASKFLNFSDIPQTDAEIVSLLDVHVHHEVPRTQAPTLLTIPVFVITESSPAYTNIPQSSQTFTPSPILTTPTPLPIIETINPLSKLPNFASVFQFNNRITSLEKEVAKIKKDPLHTQVTSLVDEHLDTRLGETKEEFMNFLSESLTARIKEQVYLLNHNTSYEAALTLTKFGLKKILFLTEMERCTKSQPKSSGKSVQSEEPVFEVADSDMPQDQEGNLGDNEDEPRNETASRRDWFKKPTPPQEPTDPDWNIGKTTQEGPTQNWLMTLAASTSTDKSLKDFDELMSTPIDFSGYILNGLKIENLTQEILLGPAFRLLKGTRSNYAELEYDFEECYKALSEKLD
ncbi:hypothetical protein Tco_0030810 [Tanacetum coccineum]